MRPSRNWSLMLTVTSIRSQRISGFTPTQYKEWYQAFFWVLIDLIMLHYWVLGLDYQSIWWSDREPGLIIKPFDNQAFWDAWWLSWLFRLQNVYSQIKQSRLKPLSKPISQPAPSPPSSYQPPDTVDYLRFLYVSSSAVKTPLSSQVGNFVLIDAFNVLSRVLSMVLFLRTSCCFPAEKDTRSIPPPDAGQPWNCLHILTTSGYVWLTWACPDRQLTIGLNQPNCQRCLPDWTCH